MLLSNLKNKRLRNAIFLGVLILLAAGIRLLYTSRLPYLQRDEIYYLDLFRRCNGEETFHVDPVFQDPHLPIGLVGGGIVLRQMTDASPEVCLKIVVLALSSLLPLSLFLLGKRLGLSESAVWTLAVFGIFYPSAVKFGSVMLRDGPYLALFLLCMAMIIDLAERMNFRNMILVLGSFTLCCLFRKEALELVLLYCFFAVAKQLLQQPHDRIARAAGTMMTIMLCLGIWIVMIVYLPRMIWQR